MAQVTATIASKVGLHARPAATFVKAVAAGGAIVHDNPVVVDGFITTSRGAGTSIDLGLEIVRQLLGEDAAEAISRGIVRTH